MNDTQNVIDSQASAIVTTDPGFVWTDAGLVLVVILAAVAYLYHKLWRKRGACGECGGKNGQCASRSDAGCGPTGNDPSPRVSVDRIGGRHAPNG